MADLQLQNVSKRYNAFEAVRDVSLSIKDGDFAVFVGPSGCGKSTLLRLIAGLDPVSSGRIVIGGEDMTSRQAGQRPVAMVFQSYALYPHMSVKENIAFPLEMEGKTKADIDIEVAKAAETVKLTARLRDFPSKLSGGQRQRVAIARAIVRKPGIFLMDEPLSNLDAALRMDMRAELAQLHRRLGSTMVYVTHDQLEAMTMADRIVVLNAGKVEQTGRPMELYHRPANRFVAGFIGSPPMNFLAGRVVEAQAGMASVDVAGLGQVEMAYDGPAPVAGEAATIGIRPEAIGLEPPLASEASLALNVLVQSIERLGLHTIVYSRLGDLALTCLFTGDPAIESNSMLQVYIPINHMHYFDGQGQARRRSD